MRATALLAIAAAALVPAAHLAAAYPTKPVRLIVPGPPGGSTDILGRLVAGKLTERFRQQVIVDNRPGAGGLLGGELVARAARDGYTLGLVYTAHTTNASLVKKMPFDPVTDFTAISLISTAPLVLVLHPAVQANSVRDLVALAKAKPGALNYGSAGNGSGGHLSGALLNLMAGIDTVHIPYKGAALAAADVAAGQIQFQFAANLTAQPLVRAGKLKLIAVTSAKRATALPEVPAVAESGLPGYEVINWFGVLAPAGLPTPLAASISAEIQRIMREPEVKEKLAFETNESIGSTPMEFARFLAADVAKWAKVVKATNMKAE